MADEEQRSYEQMDKRIDTLGSHIDREAQTNKEFRSETRDRVHRYRGTVGTMAESMASQENEIRELKQALDRTDEIAKTAAGVASALKGVVELQGKDITSIVADLGAIATDFKDALGHEGWVLKRLKGQDDKWTRIYFLIISLLLSVITLTATLWLTQGGK